VHEKPHVLAVRVDIKVVDALSIDQRGPALHAMHDIALLQQQFREIGAILAGHAGDQRDFTG
jgi:hypothetical protein